MTLTRSPKRALVAAVAVAALIPAGIVASAQGSTATSAASKVVTLKNKRFHPATVTITKGAHVTWKWAENVPHNIISTGGKFRSLTSIKSSGKYVVTFKKKGTFKYQCTLHPGMVGKVIVK